MCIVLVSARYDTDLMPRSAGIDLSFKCSHAVAPFHACCLPDAAWRRHFLPRALPSGQFAFPATFRWGSDLRTASARGLFDASSASCACRAPLCVSECVCVCARACVRACEACVCVCVCVCVYPTHKRAIMTSPFLPPSLSLSLRAVPHNQAAQRVATGFRHLDPGSSR